MLHIMGIFELRIRESTTGIKDPVLMNLSKSFELLSNVLSTMTILILQPGDQGGRGGGRGRGRGGASGDTE